MTADNSIAITSMKPYASPDSIVVAATRDERLPKSDRTLTYLKRYLLKERGRERVSGIEQITGRTQIGRR